MLRVTQQVIPKANSLKKVLVIRPGGIGDAVLLLPSLKILRKIEPSADIDMLCEPRNMGVFASSPFLSNIYNYRNLADLFTVSRKNYELVVDTEQSHFLSAVLASRFRRSLTAGFATNGRRIYHIAVPYSQDQYEMHSFFELFREVIRNWPAEFTWDPPYFFPSLEEEARVAHKVKGVRHPLICIFPGASIRERHWPIQNWATVIEGLWDRGYSTIILGGRKESTLTKEIVQSVTCPVHNMCSELSLSEITALFKRARVLISTDSGILHLGVLCDISTVSLFGPGIAEKWGPRGEKHIVLNKRLECSPCTLFGETPSCSKGALCMKLISADEVLSAVTRLGQK